MLSKERWSLIPYMYLFILDVLSYMINNLTYNIENLELSNNTTVRNQCFVNDTILYLCRTLKNLHCNFEVLELFFSFKIKDFYNINIINTFHNSSTFG